MNMTIVAEALMSNAVEWRFIPPGEADPDSRTIARACDAPSLTRGLFPEWGPSRGGGWDRTPALFLCRENYQTARGHHGWEPRRQETARGPPIGGGLVDFLTARGPPNGGGPVDS